MEVVDDQEMSLLDRFAVGVVKALLVICSIYIGMVVTDWVRYLAVVGLLTFAVLRLYFPPRVKVPR